MQYSRTNNGKCIGKLLYLHQYTANSLTSLCAKKISPARRYAIGKNKELCPKLGTENFATAYRSSKRAIDLARQRWTLGA